MKEWRLMYKVALITIIGVMTLGGLVSLINNFQDGALIFGIVCLICGLLIAFAGLISLVSPNKDWSKGLLIGAGVLLLISGISCGTGLSGMNFH